MSAPAGSELDIDIEFELMAGVVRGDIRAFEALYDRLSGAAFSLAMRIVNDRGAASDVTQEAFLELWLNRDRYRPERGAPRHWMTGIVRNRAIDSYRRSVTRGGLPRDHQWRAEQAAPDNTEERTIAHDEARLIRSALQRLPVEQQTVIDLAYFAGLTQTEIAIRLELPLGTVKGRVRLAINHLEGSLAQLA